MRFVRGLRGWAIAARVAALMLAALVVFAGPASSQTGTPAPDATTPAGPTAAAPSTSAQAAPAAGLPALGTALDRIEAALRAEERTDADLEALRQQLLPLRDTLQSQIDVLLPRVGQADTRLKQLGSPPAANAPPEAPAIAAERVRLNQLFSDLDAALKQARLLALRADQLSDRITDQRRNIFTRQLLTRRAGVLDAAFWTASFKALQVDLESIGFLVRAGWAHTRARVGIGDLAAAILSFGVALGLIGMLRRWSGRWFDVPRLPSRFSTALAAAVVLLRETLTVPLGVLALVTTAASYDLTSPRMIAVGFGAVVATVVASFGRAVARALFGAPDRRLFNAEPRTARLLVEHMTWGSRVLGGAILINALHKVVSAPLMLTVTTSALLAMLITLLLVHLLWRLPSAAGAAAEDGTRFDPSLQWLRAVGWLFVAAMGVSLATGYVALAAFLAGRLIAAAAVGGVLAIALVFIDSLFTDVLRGDSPRGRAIAGMFGLSARGIELVGTLLSALLRVMLVIAAVAPLIGPWNILAADVFGTLRGAVFGFRIGDLRISLVAILGSLAFLLVGVLLVRAVQRWMEQRLLPRAGLDPSLQLSISTLFGYAGYIIVLGMVMAELGIDLQKIALVAGALSVGIGFGLQSVVSNFVSGLILLAERPIRVGDWVVVNSEEGYVRRISVRATEIETFDRASVIIPNSEFITGVVKNWTHANTVGRITVRVGVAYGSSPEQVRDLLLECAREHPQVLKTPAPMALLLNFGDSSLDFELRCYLANISYVLAVKSDLNFAVLHKFREAGIEIPYPQRDLHWRSPPPSPAADAPPPAEA